MTHLVTIFVCFYMKVSDSGCHHRGRA